MINDDRNRFIHQHIELYGEELFLDSLPYKTRGKPFGLTKTARLDSLSLKVKNEIISKTDLLEKKIVFGSGDPDADLLIIGESPSDYEIEHNKIFLGQSGKLLDKILKAIGFNRFLKVYLTHLIKCKIDGSRDPLKSEINRFIPFLSKQIEIIDPKIIVGLGKVVGKALTGENLSMDKMRSKNYSFSSIPLKITYSPSTLIREQSLKKLAWEDFKFIRDFIN